MHRVLESSARREGSAECRRLLVICHSDNADIASSADLPG